MTLSAADLETFKAFERRTGRIPLIPIISIGESFPRPDGMALGVGLTVSRLAERVATHALADAPHSPAKERLRA